MQQWEDVERRRDAFASHVAAVGKFIEALVEADRQDRVAEFGKRPPPALTTQPCAKALPTGGGDPLSLRQIIGGTRGIDADAALADQG